MHPMSQTKTKPATLCVDMAFSLFPPEHHPCVLPPVGLHPVDARFHRAARIDGERLSVALAVYVVVAFLPAGYDITLHTLPPAELAPLISEEYEELGDEFERARGELYDMQHPPRTTK